MGHGGHRPGTGRPRNVTRSQCIGIGADCENMWRELAIAGAADKEAKQARVRARRFEASVSEKADEHVGNRTNNLDVVERLRDTERRLAGIPISERGTRALDKTNLGEGGTSIDELVGDRQVWIEARSGPLISYKRTPDGALVRPWGQEDDVITAVAASASKRLGKIVSTRTVRECWDKYRAFLKHSKT